MKRICLFLLIQFIVMGAAASDSIKTISAAQMLEIVKRYHPVSRKATIDTRIAKAGIMSARGNFDPVFNYKSSGKTFTDIDYYRSGEPEIRIPAWYGLEITAGAANLNGNRLNPEETIGATSYVGISIPLAKNLLIDKRRAVLQQAKIMHTTARNEQKSILNNLYYEAMDAYWNWVLSWQVYELASETVTVNEKRMGMIKRTWQQGDRPAIDTLEARVQWQHFLYLQNEALMEARNAAITLSVFLWTNNNEPVTLTEAVRPPKNWQQEAASNPLPVMATLLETARNQHPDLTAYEYKLQYLRVEKKLKFQDLLPAVYFNYNQLGKGYNLAKTVAVLPVFQNNFQYNISIGVPLLRSEARGEYQKTKLKISQVELDWQYKQRQVENKIIILFNEWVTLQQQLQLQEAAYAGYRLLQSGEEKRFFNGESSLFLVNTREQKALEAMNKLLEVNIKLQKTRYALQWAAGSLFNGV
jgi:outer membrane protein TolC